MMAHLCQCADHILLHTAHYTTLHTRVQILLELHASGHVGSVLQGQLVREDSRGNGVDAWPLHVV
jgi:hypothetical protein